MIRRDGDVKAVMTGAKLRFAGVLTACFFGCTAPTLAQKPRLATLAQQKMCADQAKKFFDEADTLRKPPKPAIAILPASYVDHYDVKANVCYIAIETIESIDGGKTLIYSTAVFDAFEQTAYADYSQTSDRVKNYSESKPPLVCAVEPQDQPEVTCKSEHEFNELIKKYFGLIAR
jgi:hypothetical protein